MILKARERMRNAFKARHISSTYSSLCLCVCGSFNSWFSIISYIQVAQVDVYLHNNFILIYFLFVSSLNSVFFVLFCFELFVLVNDAFKQIYFQLLFLIDVSSWSSVNLFKTYLCLVTC